MSKSDLTFSVGITSCYAKEQIIDTIRSIRASEDVADFPIYLISDNIPLSANVKRMLRKLRVIMIENNFRSSAYAKQKQILSLVKADVIIFTQDDVIFSRDTLSKVIRLFENNTDITFAGVKNTPLKPVNIFERAVNVGTFLNNSIAEKWNDGDNYLAIIGRLMAFRTNWLKNKMLVEEDSVSLDAYLYFENLRLGGRYKCIWDTELFFRNPQKLNEQLKKSSRFQHSNLEMKQYNKFEGIDDRYKIPLKIILISSFQQFIRSPFSFIIYVFIFTYTRLHKIPAKISLNPTWDIDLSTKRLKR